MNEFVTAAFYDELEKIAGLKREHQDIVEGLLRDDPSSFAAAKQLDLRDQHRIEASVRGRDAAALLASGKRGHRRTGIAGLIASNQTQLGKTSTELGGHARGWSRRSDWQPKKVLFQRPYAAPSIGKKTPVLRGMKTLLGLT